MLKKTFIKKIAGINSYFADDGYSEKRKTVTNVRLRDFLHKAYFFSLNRGYIVRIS